MILIGKKLYRRIIHRTPDYQRFRDYGTLKYQFRGIEKFMPWIRNVYLVLQSESQIPKWLNTKQNKLKIIYHKDFIPKDFLPTFNSSVIEMWYHRIDGLADSFLLSNDDMIPIKPLKEEDYFRDGKPVYPIRLKNKDVHFTGQSTWDHILFNSRRISRLAGKKTVHSFTQQHLILPHSVKIWKEVWKNSVGKLLLTRSMTQSPVRKKYNANNWLFEFYAAMTNQAILDPDSAIRGSVGIDSEEAIERLKQIVVNAKVICINDCGYNSGNLEQEVKQILDGILPDKSSFEI
jgi:hypothetical protein